MRNNRLKFKTAGKLPINLEEFIELYPGLIKENRRMSTRNRLDLRTRKPTSYAQKSPGSLVQAGNGMWKIYNQNTKADDERGDKLYIYI